MVMNDTNQVHNYTVHVESTDHMIIANGYKLVIKLSSCNI